MANNTEQRTLTYLFEIKSDGKKVAEIKRSVKDVENAVRLMNEATADNIKVEARSLSTKEEALAQVRRAITESNKLTSKINNVTDAYKSQLQAINMTAEQQEVFNAQAKAGVSATSEQGKEIEKLVTEYQQQKLAVDAAREAEELEIKALKELEVAREAERLEVEKQQRKLDDYVQSLRNQLVASSMNAEQQEVFNAQLRAGVSATSEQGKEIERLTLSRLKNERATREQLQSERASNAEKERSEKQVSDVISKYTSLNTALRQTDVNLEVLNAQMRAGVSATSEQGRQIERLVTEYQQLRNQGDAAGRSMRNFRGIAQNVGWQMQDTVVQLQMGTDAFIVLSQQGSQIASAFGAGGAILGAFIAIAGVVGGTLFKGLNSATDATEKLETAQRVLNSVLDTSALTVEGYTDELKELAKVDAELAELKLVAGIDAVEDSIDSNVKKLGEFIGQIRTVGNTSGQMLGGTVIQSFVEIQKQLGITSSEAESLYGAFEWYRETSDISNFRNEVIRLKEVYQDTNDTFNKSAESLVEFITEAVKLDNQLTKLYTGLDTLNESTDESASKTSKQRDVAAELIDEYANLNATFGLSERAIAKYNIAQELASNNQLAQLPIIEQLVDNLFDLKDAEEEAAEAAKKREEARRLKAIEALRIERELNKERNRLSKEYVKLQRDLTRIDKEIEGERSNHTWVMVEMSNHEARIEELNALRTIAARRGYLDEVTGIDRAIEAERQRHLGALAAGQSGVSSLTPFMQYFKNREQLEESHVKNINALREKLNNTNEVEARKQINAAIQQETLNHELAMTQSYMNQMQGVASIASQTLGLMTQAANLLTAEGAAAMERQMEGMNDTQKALFIMTQTVAAAMALVNGMDLGMKMAAMFGNPALVGVGTALGATTAGAIMGTTIAGAFDKGGVIPQGQYGVVAEYGDELVDGVLVKGKSGGTRVTSREDTAKMLNQGGDAGSGGGMTIVQHITVQGNGDAALTSAMRKAAKQGAQEGYAMVAQDFKQGRGIRQTLRKSARV